MIMIVLLWGGVTTVHLFWLLSLMIFCRFCFVFFFFHFQFTLFFRSIILFSCLSMFLLPTFLLLSCCYYYCGDFDSDAVKLMSWVSGGGSSIVHYCVERLFNALSKLFQFIYFLHVNYYTLKFLLLVFFCFMFDCLLIKSQWVISNVQKYTVGHDGLLVFNFLLQKRNFKLIFVFVWVSASNNNFYLRTKYEAQTRIQKRFSFF